jgi:NH3-dependent NAD+ synthetase
MKYGDHREPGKCPPVEQLMYLIDCLCGQCHKSNSFYIKPRTPELIKKYNKEATEAEWGVSFCLVFTKTQPQHSHHGNLPLSRTIPIMGK